MSSHFVQEDAPSITPAATKWLGGISAFLLALLLIIFVFRVGCAIVTTTPATTQPMRVTPGAAVQSELFEQRIAVPRWHKGCEEAIARGNVPMAIPSLEEPTVFVEPVINGYARVRLDGTNEWSSQQRDRWFHSISEVWVQPNHSLTVDALALNPDTKLAYSSTGEATDVFGRLYDPSGNPAGVYNRELREKEEIIFSLQLADGTRRPSKYFGMPFLILVNRAITTPHEAIVAAQSFEHSSAARVRFYNTTHKPMRIAIGLHRNILKRTVSCRAPHDVVEVYGESGWTGGFWEFSVKFNQEASPHLASIAH